MNGPHHYELAEDALQYARECDPANRLDMTNILLTALAHATLAHAAAAAESPKHGSLHSRWDKVGL